MSKKLILLIALIGVMVTIAYAVTTTWNVWAPMSTTAPLKNLYVYSDSTLKANTQDGQVRTLEFTAGSYDREYWQFTNGDTRPTIADHKLYLTDSDAATDVTITNFVGGKVGQIITVRSISSVIFDKDTLLSGTTDITTGVDDITRWMYNNSTSWVLVSHTDMSDDNN